MLDQAVRPRLVIPPAPAPKRKPLGPVRRPVLAQPQAAILRKPKEAKQRKSAPKLEAAKLCKPATTKQGKPAANKGARQTKAAEQTATKLYDRTTKLRNPAGRTQRKSGCPTCAAAAKAAKPASCPTCGVTEELKRPPAVAMKMDASGAQDPAERQADAIGARIGASLASVPSFGPGPLPEHARAAAEPHLGVSLAGTVLRADRGAQRKAASESALAVTEGRTVSFAKGQFSSSTSAGRALIGHELTHVGQQGAAGAEARQQAPDPNGAGGASGADGTGGEGGTIGEDGSGGSMGSGGTTGGPGGAASGGAASGGAAPGGTPAKKSLLERLLFGKPKSLFTFPPVTLPAIPLAGPLGPPLALNYELYRSTRSYTPPGRTAPIIVDDVAYVHGRIQLQYDLVIGPETVVVGAARTLMGLGATVQLSASANGTLQANPSIAIVGERMYTDTSKKGAGRTTHVGVQGGVLGTVSGTIGGNLIAESYQSIVGVVTLVKVLAALAGIDIPILYKRVTLNALLAAAGRIHADLRAFAGVMPASGPQKCWLSAPFAEWTREWAGIFGLDADVTLVVTPDFIGAIGKLSGMAVSVPAAAGAILAGSGFVPPPPICPEIIPYLEPSPPGYAPTAPAKPSHAPLHGAPPAKAPPGVPAAKPPSAPTGLAAGDPIAMRWFKTYADYPPVITLVVPDSPGSTRDYDMRHQQKLPPPYDASAIGGVRIPDAFTPAFEKKYKYGVTEARRFRSVLKTLRYDWAGMEADHVHDRAFSGVDEFKNLWPLKESINASKGPSQNRWQHVTFSPTPGAPSETVHIGDARLRGRWFKVAP